MVDPALNRDVVRFGVFELDRQARELRKAGVKIKLQDQPFEILSVLLDRPGEIVTREELQKRLWPADTFVDFDLSLNSAVKKLRQALNDDSGSPRFVETLYRRGYRFIGPMAGSAKPELVEVAEPEVQQRKPAPRISYRKTSLLASMALLLAGIVVWLLVPNQKPRVLGYTQITHDGRPKGGIVTDGGRLYFTELDGDHFVVAEVSANGGETAILPIPFDNVGLTDLAPDGSALLISSFKGGTYNGVESGAWTLPLPAGAPRRVGDLSGQAAASWSPDGHQLVFTRDSAIYVAKSDGSGAVKLGAVNGTPQNFRFSPDGRTIRFDVNDPKTGANDLWEMKSDGHDIHQLLVNWGDAVECCGNWTPDGKYYLFESLRDGANNLWLLPGQSHWYSRRPKPIQLTNGPLEFGYPLPSKDGKKIFSFGVQPRVELLQVKRDGSLAPYAASRSAVDLAFSADGKWVAYVVVPEHTLWRSRVDGSEPLQLTSSSTYVALPRWSPDGTRIAFMGRPSNGSYHAYVIASNGGTPQPLVPGTDGGADPGWSPDGKSIVVTLGVPSDSVGSGISIVDLFSRRVTLLPDSKNYFSPRWSPDGKYITAITLDSSKVVLFETATQRWSELATNGPIGYPSWSHDSEYLYYDTTLTGDPGLYRARMSDKKIEKLCTLKTVRRFRGDFGPWMGLAPDDTPLLTRDMSSQEIYALDWEAP